MAKGRRGHSNRYKLPFDPKDSGYILPEKRDHGVREAHQIVMQDMPLLSVDGTPISGSWDGKTEIRLDHITKQFTGGYWPLVRQLIGDCVGFGSMKAALCTAAADQIIKGDFEAYLAEYCTEWAYSTGRLGPGRGRLGNSDGSVGSWQAAAMLEHGMLHRVPYTGPKSGQKFDLREYDGRRAKDWGFRGLPWELEEIADRFAVSRKCALVQNTDMAADALMNGYAIFVCSRQGFYKTRDRDGFLKPGPTWAHCMAIIGIVIVGRRIGFILDNGSWGNWCSGPNPKGLPPGCGAIDIDVLQRMLRQDDSYAVPGVNGFVPQKLDWTQVF